MNSARDRRVERTVAVLEADPGLGARLSADDFSQARQYLRASVVTLMHGERDPGVIGGPDLLALVVIDGWLIRNVTLGGRVSGMLIGPGSLLRPRDDHLRYGTIPFSVQWRALQPTQLALLDQRTMVAAARWPGLMHALFRRASERSHIQSVLAAIRALQHVELRLRALRWLYAGRCGQRGPDGVVLPVRLSQQDLADLTGSQRPSVSAHLAALSASDDIVRRPDRTCCCAVPRPASCMTCGCAPRPRVTSRRRRLRPPRPTPSSADSGVLPGVAKRGLWPDTLSALPPEPICSTSTPPSPSPSTSHLATGSAS